MENNIFIILLLIALFMMQVIAIYLLLIRKRFNFKNKHVEKDISTFLNELDEGVAKRENKTDKKLNMLTKALKKHEQKRKEMLSKADEIISKVTGQADKISSQNEKKINDIVNAFKAILKDHSQNINSMQEEIKVAKDLVAEKEEKNRRYEEGYDQKNIKQFRNELFRLVELIKRARIKDDSDMLQDIEDNLILLLENNGIEKIKIKTGDAYENLMRDAKIIATVETNDASQDGRIKETKKDGYFIQIDKNDKKVIRPAEVTMYKIANTKGDNSND